MLKIYQPPIEAENTNVASEGKTEVDARKTDPHKPLLVDLKHAHAKNDLLEGKKFFVLRGYMKSGTNWIGRMLNLHPEISCTGEFHWQTLTNPLYKLLQPFEQYVHAEELQTEIWIRFDRFIKESIVLANAADAVWVGDRTPHKIWPGVVMGAKVLDLVRDGRDVVVSRAFHFFNNPDQLYEYRDLPGNQNRIKRFQKDPSYFFKHPEELLACPELVIDSAKEWSRHVRHNQEIRTKFKDPELCRQIRYEAFHEHVERERSRLYQFFDVDPALAAPLGEKTRPGFSKERPGEFLRKGTVGDWQNYFNERTASLFNEHAGETLIRLGYAEDFDWLNLKHQNQAA